MRKLLLLLALALPASADQQDVLCVLVISYPAHNPQAIGFTVPDKHCTPDTMKEALSTLLAAFLKH